jgi:hypothetical protein
VSRRVDEARLLQDDRAVDTFRGDKPVPFTNDVRRMVSTAAARFSDDISATYMSWRDSREPTLKREPVNLSKS